ncbi:MAG TPA: class I SAM-dependent methyltransferase [Labilithrix sp.]|nr:class I SAM-dependent methyltransferase [Labilithrix sp.]
MDAITTALRGMYEEFPYPPAAAPEQRTGWNVELLLAYGKNKPASTRRIVLDAGCGRGAGLIGAAALQPNVTFVGADINRVALAEAREQAKARRLTNVSFHEVDLVTLEGLEIPSGGFDAIFSSGVVHHMPDPVIGLGKLASVLAPHGMLQLMVYGRRGREPLYRLVRAMDRLLPREFPLRDRLMVARELTKSLTSDAVSCGPWADIKSIGDVELVDRYLNVNERSYDIPDLFELLDRSHLRFVRWTEPAEWDLASIVKSGPVMELAARLSDRERFMLVDELAWRPRFELVVCGEANERRPSMSATELMQATLAVSPEVSFVTEVRNVGGGQRVESVAIRVRSNPPVSFENGLLASALLFLKDATEPFRGSELVFLLGKNGIPLAPAQELLAHLVSSEILYALP